ncbi:hypothetical protein C3V43_07125 [Bacteroides heparinolyticus]|uniref:DUF4465 domain-containing protein n=1 Tax=Prevotella heparinolytica TaxID=28113 RepID=UPI000D026248|nr:DUF4465 domain-containing protein [Bacteroides heparinolyticus]AVM57553.1 hypothetical protein C3V43_07125 [Bacteroides heparinolyticus]
MKTKIFVLGVMALTFAGCQNTERENDLSVVNQRTEEVEALVDRPLVMEAPVKGADSYAWFRNGKLVSTDSEYTFQEEKSGTYNVVLETTTRGVQSKVTYAVSNEITLSSELNQFVLNSGNGIQPEGQTGYYWNQTYTNTKFHETPHFTFSHTGTNSGYGYWDGFTVSNVYDSSNFGTYTTDTIHSGSVNWIAHQWGCMDRNNSNTNFMLGYWGYYGKDIQNFPIDPENIPYPTAFTETGFSNWIKLGDGNTNYTVKRIKITNSPWAYYGCKEGDGFATPFNSPSDYLRLLVFPVYASGVIGSPKIIELAGFNSQGFWGTNSWTLSEYLGFHNVRYLLFQMRSSDSGQYGMNTAAYFCLNNIVMQ